MGLFDLIRNGFFKNFIDFSHIGSLLLVWAFLVGGYLIQNIINRNTKTVRSQWSFLAVLLIVIIIMQIASNAFKSADQFPAVLFIFGLIICAAVGAAISGVIWYINYKRGLTEEKE